MKTIYIVIFAILIGNPVFSQSEVLSEKTTYYLIRHAEKDRSDTSNKNPHLNELGKLRANQWNTVFSKVRFDAIYSTDYNRTKETAQPTADKNEVKLSIYNPSDFSLDDFLRDTKGKTTLIVGHSNTTPFFANAIIGQDIYKQIDDNNNSNLYIVTIINGKISNQLLVVD